LPPRSQRAAERLRLFALSAGGAVGVLRNLSIALSATRYAGAHEHLAQVPWRRAIDAEPSGRRCATTSTVQRHEAPARAWRGICEIRCAPRVARPPAAARNRAPERRALAPRVPARGWGSIRFPASLPSTPTRPSILRARSVTSRANAGRPSTISCAGQVSEHDDGSQIARRDSSPARWRSSNRSTASERNSPRPRRRSYSKMSRAKPRHRGVAEIARASILSMPSPRPPRVPDHLVDATPAALIVDDSCPDSDDGEEPTPGRHRGDPAGWRDSLARAWLWTTLATRRS